MVADVVRLGGKMFVEEINPSLTTVSCEFGGEIIASGDIGENDELDLVVDQVVQTAFYAITSKAR
jgi:hypothetical protein